MKFSHPRFKNDLLLISLIIFYLLWIPAGIGAAGQPSSLKVDNITPRGEMVDHVYQIIISFSEPMVPVGTTKSRTPAVKVRPHLPKGEFTWLDPSRLAFIPEEGRLPASTRYTLRIAAKTTKSLKGARLAKDFVTTFTTPRIDSRGIFLEWFDAYYPRIQIIFNQPADMVSLTDNAYFVSPSKGRIRAFVRRLNEEEAPEHYRRSYFFMPADPVPRQENCRLIIPRGLKSQEGPLPSNKPFEVKFQTYGQFRITGMAYTPADRCFCSTTFKIPKQMSPYAVKAARPDEIPSIIFSNPVRNKDFIAHLRIDPKIDSDEDNYNAFNLYSQFPEQVNRYFKLPNKIMPMQKHEISFTPGFKDKFGQPFEGPAKIVYTTGHYCPKFDILASNAIIERSGDWEIPFWVLNVSRVPVHYYALRNSSDFRHFAKFEHHKAFVDASRRELKLETLSTPDVNSLIPLDLKNFIDADSPLAAILIQFKPKISGENRRAWVFAQATDLGITYKRGYFNSMACVTKISTGQPVANANVSSYSEYEHETWRGKTDEEGIVFLPGVKSTDPFQSRLNIDLPFGRLIKAATSDDCSILPVNYLFSRGIMPPDFGYESSPPTELLAHAMSERPVYLPGEKVRFRLIIRRINLSSITMTDASEQFTVIVNDPEGNKIFEGRDIIPSEFGTATSEFELPPKGLLGRYEIEVLTARGEKQNAGAFEVASPQPTRLQVNVNTDKNEYRLGEAVQVNITVTDQNFRPVKARPGIISATLNSTRFSATEYGLGEYDFSFERTTQKTAFRNYIISEMPLSTDWKGGFKAKIQLPYKSALGESELCIEARFSDDNGNLIADRSFARVHPADFYLGIKAARFLYEANSTAAVELVAVSPDEEFVPGQAVNVELFRRKFVPNKERAGATASKTEDYRISSLNLFTEDKPIAISFPLKGPGTYIIQATSRNINGKQVGASHQFYVVGPGRADWATLTGNRVDIELDRQSYEVGQTANLIVKSPFEKARALVTIERNGIIDHFATEIDGQACALKIPVKKNYFPGVYVSANFIKARTAARPDLGGPDPGKPSSKIGYISMKVDDPERDLFVNVETDWRKYRPHDRVKIRFRISDHQGKGVKSELAVAMVSDKVIRLASDPSLVDGNYDPESVFNKLAGINIQTFETRLNMVGAACPGKPECSPIGLSKVPLLPGRLLGEFPKFTYFDPSLLTDENGDAQIEIKLPEISTRWNIYAVACDKKNRLGKGFQNFDVIAPDRVGAR
jgi:uncharacterized protein YfaS (alpha-2-macroglobulin family)